ncbi:MAG: patatin-like phospholipase family protein, partial [Syntrophaceae bacterium]
AKEGDVTILVPHEERVIAGWLDKKIKGRRPAADALDNLLLITPSPEFVQTLPGGKIPDRDDFLTFIDDPAGRILNWRKVVEICAPLGEECIDLVDSGKIRRIAEPLNLD